MPELDERECDVIVVGAGPAGACAAMRLAKRGLHVCIIEKKTLPRYKTCGGGLLRRAAPCSTSISRRRSSDNAGLWI